MMIDLGSHDDDAIASGTVQLSDAMEAYRHQIARTVQQFADIGRREHEQFISAARSLATTIVGQLSKEWRDTLPRLAKRGWYLDSALSARQIRYVVELFESGAHRKADELLMKHITKHMTRISADLVARFPHRSRLLRAAFSAHRSRRYALSVPVCLAQADGICVELLGAQLYKKNRTGKPATVEAVESFDEGWLALLSPLLEVQPIAASTHGRELTPGELNRHGILHGAILDYGTRVNSCKAISLINYVGNVVSRSKPPIRQSAG